MFKISVLKFSQYYYGTTIIQINEEKQTIFSNKFFLKKIEFSVEIGQTLFGCKINFTVNIAE